MAKGETELQKALDNCLVNFDRRVLVTDLLEEYKLSYEEIHTILSKYVREEEKRGSKFEKTFLVHGEEENRKEIYTIVKSETQLRDWLDKLKDAESYFYSLEIKGNAKLPAQIFQPMRMPALIIGNARVREVTVKTLSEEMKPENLQKEIKKCDENVLFGQKAKATSPTNTKFAPEIDKKLSPELTKAVSEENVLGPKTNVKKTINNFFAPKVKNAEKKPADSKVTTTHRSTPSQKIDFFRTETKKGTLNTFEKKKEVTVAAKSPERKTEIEVTIQNKSIELFAEEEDIHSSDEEEKLETLKREIISSDHEEETACSTMMAKRRRIVDSEDDDSPKQKYEKKEPKEMIKLESVPHSETFLDDDGFVNTIRTKRNNFTENKIVLPAQSKVKSPLQEKKMKAIGAKTKQGSIMSFFTKK